MHGGGYGSFSHPGEFGDTRNARHTKHILEGIDRIDDLKDWPSFVSQVRLMLDSVYPFTGLWVKTVGALESVPTPEWILSSPLHCECTQEMMGRFLSDLWWILRMKLSGRHSRHSPAYR